MIFTVRRTKTAELKLQIFKAELPVGQSHELPASAKLAELMDERENHTELPNTGVVELSDTTRQERLELS